jgi:hypothetical protein
MKYLFFVDTSYPGFRGSEAEKALRNCGVGYWISGVGIDFVIIQVRDVLEEECVMKVLRLVGVDYVFEMVGAPRRLRVISLVTGRVRAEAEFV